MRYLAHAKQSEALDEIPALAAEFAERFGRASGGLLETYRCEDAETVIVALGSVFGTLQELVDERRAQGRSVGALAIKSFRPFPARRAARGAVRRAARDRARAGVLRRRGRHRQPATCAPRSRASTRTWRR